MESIGTFLLHVLLYLYLQEEYSVHLEQPLSVDRKMQSLAFVMALLAMVGMVVAPPPDKPFHCPG
jgi:hypothetical protein